MSKYIKLVICKTAKPMGKTTEDFHVYDEETKEFDTLKQVKKYLEDEYFYVKTKKKIFHDEPDGEAKHTGWLFCFKSDPASHGDKHHFERHWINTYRIQSTPFLIK